MSISLPAELGKAVRSAVKRGRYTSTSEFIRHLIRRYDTDRLVHSVRQSEREYARGKGKELKGSLRDLR